MMELERAKKLAAKVGQTDPGNLVTADYAAYTLFQELTRLELQVHATEGLLNAAIKGRDDAERLYDAMRKALGAISREGILNPLNAKIEEYDEHVKKVYSIANEAILSTLSQKRKSIRQIAEEHGMKLGPGEESPEIPPGPYPEEGGIQR